MLSSTSGRFDTVPHDSPERDIGGSGEHDRGVEAGHDVRVHSPGEKRHLPVGRRRVRALAPNKKKTS
jgi:hypothetical protein